MNKFGSLGSKSSKDNSESRLLDDNGNLDLQGKRLINLGDAKSNNDAITLQNVKIILNDFKDEVVNQQILTNQYLSEDINRLTKIYESSDNILTRVDNKGLFVKNTLKITKEDINAENRRIRNVANPKNGADAVNLSTLLVHSKGFMQLSDRLDNFENVIINILEKDPDEAFKKRMKGRLKRNK